MSWLPQVRSPHLGTVDVTLDQAQALTLARILAHYDSLVTLTAVELRERWLYEDPADPTAPGLAATRGYDAVVWQQVLVDLLAEEGRPSLHVLPPTLPPAARSGSLRRVRGNDPWDIGVRP